MTPIEGGFHMNIDNMLFNELIESVGISLNINQLSTPDEKFHKLICMHFCDELIIKSYHCKPEFKTAQKLIETAFTGGVFCKILNDFYKDAEESKFAQISSLLSNTWSLEAMLIDLLENSDAAKAIEKFKLAKDTTIKKFLSLLYIKKISIGENAILKNSITVLTSAFMVATKNEII